MDARVDDGYHVAMADLDNAAQRILDVLTSLERFPKHKLSYALMHMYDVGTKTDAPLLLAAASIVELPARAVTQVSGIPDVDHEHLLAWQDEVGRAFKMLSNLDHTATQVPAQVSPVARYALRGSARAIAKAPGRRDVDDDGLAKARQDVADLLESLQASDLGSDVKTLLLRHAAAIAHALNAVRFTGSDGVEEALHAALGSAFFAARNQPEVVTTTAFAKFLGVIDNVANVITIWSGGLQITAGIFESIAQIQANG